MRAIHKGIEKVLTLDFENKYTFITLCAPDGGGMESWRIEGGTISHKKPKTDRGLGGKTSRGK